MQEDKDCLGCPGRYCTPERRQERRTDDERGRVELSLDPEYQRLVGVKIAAEAEWHQAVLIRHRAYDREKEAAAAKVKASSDLESYLQSKRLDK